jgi:hypothetical protein
VILTRRDFLGTVSAASLLAIASPADADAPLDLQSFLDDQLKSGNRRIVIPSGRYRATPRNRQHLLLANLKDVEIVADGVELICTETTRALTISHCTNASLRGLTIDYDPLPFTQGRITSLSGDRKMHEVELFDGYLPAEAAIPHKYEIFRPDTRTLRCDDRYPKTVEAIDAKRLRIDTSGGGHTGGPEQVGDIIAIAAEHAPGGSIPHAVYCDQSAGVRLESITLYASNTFGFFETNCDGSVYSKCRIDRRVEGDLIRRADPRVRSLNADAYHSKHALKGPSYLQCSARFMGDDCINICGDYHLVMASSGRTLRVLAKHEMNIKGGDPVELVAYDGRRLPDAIAVSVEPAGAIRDEERAFLAKQRIIESLRAAAKGSLNKAYTITLDRDADLPMGSVICSTARNGNGFVVKGCDFGFNRSRGILIKASRGEITGNRLEGCLMSAVLVAPEYYWLESGSSSDLTIADNTIVDCHRAAISVEAAAGNGKVALAGAHRNITIAGNTIEGSPLPCIRVAATDGLRIEGNKIRSGGGERIKTENCQNVTIRDNGS